MDCRCGSGGRCLLSKHEVLSSNLGTTKKKETETFVTRVEAKHPSVAFFSRCFLNGPSTGATSKPLVGKQLSLPGL
jgi:hypothetical protein